MAAGLHAVQDASRTWLSYALDSATLIVETPKSDDIVIDGFAFSFQSGKCEFAVSVRGVAVGGNALKENLQQVFRLDGSTSLDESGFSSENVEVDFGEPVDGKVTFTAGPKSANVGTFFMKVRVVY